MNITVKGFGLLGPMIGEKQMELAAPATVAQVLDNVTELHGDFTAHRARVAVAVGDSLVSLETPVEDGQTLVLIPPVGGG